MTQRLVIPEYGAPDAELVASEDLAREPAFWLAHLAETGSVSSDPQEYGVAASAYDAIVDRLSAETPSPVLRVPFGGGHTILVIYSNDTDVNERYVEFVVRHPNWGRLGYLGFIGPSGSGPGLSWAELISIAEARPDDGATEAGLADPAQRLLLLLPMLGDAASPADASVVVAQALVRCGISADAAPRLADELIGSDMSNRPSWSVGPDNPVPVCSSHHSARQVPIALGITPEQAQALAGALRGTS